MRVRVSVAVCEGRDETDEFGFGRQYVVRRVN
jgi:hypothetical protein